jgi:preprotein translocase SecE subunit
LRLIEFPSRENAIKSGNLVVAISLIFSLALYLVDWLFQVLRTLLISINI